MFYLCYLATVINYCGGGMCQEVIYLCFLFITVTGLLLVVAVECHYIILEYLSGSLNRIEVASFGFNHFINRDVY